MKKLSAMIIALVLVLTVSGCTSDKNTDDNTTTEYTATVNDVSLFFDGVAENKKLVDVIATNICTAWKVAEELPNSTVKTVKTDVEKSTSTYKDTLSEINTRNAEISALFEKAKHPDYLNEVNQVMDAYEKYTDLVLNPQIDGNTGGYNEITEAKRNLDTALRGLRNALNS